ncbi:putative conjugal transfer protein TrbF [Sphingomonas changbaiensis NBRC 104936]|uniref:Putative conjugal transfer protein TrbF n=2 Tax=Sphingomonas changbaiensis TaxID=529705 RepID=A0A0E9ML41_9SPHN|nr:putative conjugal transfer protein TrbF [Sphingomonas changbaiensis NBRC 104936]
MSQVKWIETSYERGAQAGSAHWTGILTVALKPPASAEALRRNPLGLYVDAIDWSRELEPGVTGPASPLPAARATAAPAPSLPSDTPLDPNLAQPQPRQAETRQ